MVLTVNIERDAMTIMKTLEKILGHKPTSIEIANAGFVLLSHDRLERANELFREAIRQDPEMPEPWNNYGIALFKMGRIEKALEMYAEAISIRADWQHRGNYLFCQHYLDEEQEKIPELTREFVRIHVAPLYRKGTFPKLLSPRSLQQRFGRRIRVGYVSGDFRRHSCSFFLRPIFQNYDEESFELFLYSTLAIKDTVTKEFGDMCDHWRNLHEVGTDAAAEMILKDEIDILVDLAGYTVGNRCDVFARKPAPIQVSYLGYPNSTGIATIDYRIVDIITDPIDTSENETLVRLPNFLCYGGPVAPGEAVPPVTELPYFKNQFLTLASFNCLSKITPKVVKLWGQIMREIPTARIIIKAKELLDEKARSILLFRFLQQGISPERIKLLSWLPYNLRLQLYNWVDVCLDTFPYCGVTTTCDGLYMGVPTVTLKGNYHVSRVGASVMSAAGMEDWIVESQEEYVDKIVNLDIRKLEEERHVLRAKMEASQLMDGADFANCLEYRYFQMVGKYERDTKCQEK